MQLTTRQHLMQFAHLFQTHLFGRIKEEVGELGPQAQLLVQVLTMAPLAPWLCANRGPGRPREDRRALAAAFVAKAIFNCATTPLLLGQLQVNAQLRRLCRWSQASEIPHESTFSRAFAEFAGSELPQKVHQALILSTQRDRLIGHISRDSTAIEAREKFPRATEPQPARARRRKPQKPLKAKASERGTQIERQRFIQLPAMLAGLPRDCAIGVKTSSKGHAQYWRGFKLHTDVADGQIPISAILTGANVNDAVAAIPLMSMSAERVTWLYDVMDSAYDADVILEQCRKLGHVPIVKAPLPAQRKIAIDTTQDLPWQARARDELGAAGPVPGTNYCGASLCTLERLSSALVTFASVEPPR